MGVPLEKKLSWLLVGLTAAGIVLVVALVPNPGRPAAGVLVLGCAGWLVVARAAHARYAAALKAAARELGLDYLSTCEQERASSLLERMRKTAESDVFRWKVDGKLPAVVGELEGFPVAVRVPVGIDFDAGSPDSTRIAAYHNVRMTGFTVYDRSRVRKPPKGRVALTGDTAFDRRFLVLAHRTEEATTVLSPAVRLALLEAGGTGFRGIEFNRYGVFLHEEGKVSSPALLSGRLRLVVTLAEAAAELERRREP